MLTRKSPDQVIGLADQAAQSADSAIKSTRRAASDTIDAVATAAQDIRAEAIAPLLNRAADKANAMAERGADAYRQGYQRVRDTASRGSVSTLSYVRNEPVKALLIAAAGGAALMALASLLGRSRRGD